MRILFVSTNLPVPANNGQAIRSISIVQALAASGHYLTFVSFADRGQSKSLHSLSSFCREIDVLERECTSVSQRSDYLSRISYLMLGKSFSLERFRSEAMRVRIQRHLKALRFDLIFCDSLYSLVNVPHTEIPIALNCHNVEHVILQRYSKLEKNLITKSYATVEARLLRDAEKEGCRRATIAMVCSNYDGDLLHQLSPDLPIAVIPNAVDTDLYSPQPDFAGTNTDLNILFQGSMDWYPNRDAVEFFALDILPLVRAEFPGVKFVIAGRNPPASLVEKLTTLRGVEFTGTVPDIRPYLSLATVVVVPLRLGSGTRIKILEACAAGKAIVSTRVGAEGLELKGGKEIVLADDAAEFAHAVITLMRDPARSEAIGKSARSVVLEHYTHQALRKSLEVVISSLAKQGSMVESIQ
jgi:glycosyltransferase involved in cell wall biosynthesis